MSYWSRRTVLLDLSPTGRVLFGGDENGVLEVFVEWADDLGLWIFYGETAGFTRTVRLLQWNHFESATLNVEISEAVPKTDIGFRPQRIQ